MPLLSEELSGHPTEKHSRMYQQFRRAQKAGKLRALELSSKLKFMSSRQKECEKPDYAFLAADADEIRKLLAGFSRPPYELTAAEATLMGDETLDTLIRLQDEANKVNRRKSPPRKSTPRSRKSSPDEGRPAGGVDHGASPLPPSNEAVQEAGAGYV